MPAKVPPPSNTSRTLGDRLDAVTPAKSSAKRHPHGNLGKFLHKKKGAK